MEAYRKVYPTEFYKRFLSQNVRPDARSISKIRKTAVTSGSIQTADASSFVKLGNTSLVAGIKAEVGDAPSVNIENLREKPNNLIINVELTPICSTQFQQGKPSEQAMVIGHSLSNWARDTKLIDEKDLIFNEIKEEDIDEDNPIKSLYWYLFVDIYCLNYDGNVFDASAIALLAALKNLQLPTGFVDEDNNITCDLPYKNINLLHHPVPVTFAMYDIYILVDPTHEEEKLQTSSMTIVYNENNQLVSVSKPGGNHISEEKMKECFLIAKKRVSTVLKLLEKSQNLYIKNLEN